MGHCPDLSQTQGLIAVTEIVDEIGIETAEISENHENSVIHGTAEMIAGSINVVIGGKANGHRTGPQTGQIVAVTLLRNRQENHHHPSKSGFLPVLNHVPQFPLSSLMPNLCTTESQEMSL